MSVLKPELVSVWESVYNMGLWDEKTNIDFDAFNALIEHDNETLTTLLHQCEDTEYIRNLSFDELLKLPFDGAKKAIDSFSMEKRIKMLNELDERKNFYYNQTARYCGVSGDQLISASEFRSLLGKIKHIEILQNWLFGLA
jgi:hypothetical protein